MRNVGIRNDQLKHSSKISTCAPQEHLQKPSNSRAQDAEYNPISLLSVEILSPLLVDSMPSDVFVGVQLRLSSSYGYPPESPLTPEAISRVPAAEPHNEFNHAAPLTMGGTYVSAN